jgi:hypothetical protein
MNVDYRPWRVQSIQDGGRYMTVVSPSGETRTADLSVLNWDKYCADAADWLKEEGARLARMRAAEEAEHKRALKQALREWREFERQALAADRLLASGYGSIDDLEREVILVDLEDTDANEILAVDCQTFHLERLTA